MERKKENEKNSQQPAEESSESPSVNESSDEKQKTEVVSKDVPVDSSENEAQNDSQEAITDKNQKPKTEVPSSVQAKTHAKNRKTQKTILNKVDIIPGQKKWQTLLGLGVGAIAIVALVVSGVSSQYFKGKTMPGVYVADIANAAKTPDVLQEQLSQQKQDLKIKLQAGEKQLEPTQQEIGFEINVEQTVKNAMKAKREDGLFTRMAFWKKVSVPAVVTVDNARLNQYIETHLPELNKAPQDSRLEFNAPRNTFIVTPQADGEGVDTELLTKQLLGLSEKIQSKSFTVQITKKAPAITEQRLAPLVAQGNALTNRQIILTGSGYTFRARPADIASWITPTPQEDDSINLVVDPAKVQSYVDAIGKRVSNTPLDRKVIRDQNSGEEIIIQEGRNGTILSDRQILAETITKALKSGQNSTQTMQIKTAEFKTVNMEAYDKWVEVDLKNQRATLYTGATPVHVFTISSGLAKTPTVTGEFKVWHKNTVQTMSGGSRAAGDFYNLPNVKWNTYFYKDYAFHTAYWHNNFGQPMSRGCVNMRESDAKILYDFAPIGTTVIVHS